MNRKISIITFHYVRDILRSKFKNLNTILGRYLADKYEVDN